MSADHNDLVQFTYTNSRGQTTVRTVLPVRIWFGHTRWEPEEQWLLHAFDLDKQQTRDFAMSRMSLPWEEYRDLKGDTA